jgi:hypothetical protein
MRIKSKPLTAISVTLILTLLLIGCSGMQLAYNTADFFIERYAADYLELDGDQMQRWSPLLDAALARHREQELPYLASFFNTAQNEARKGFSPAGIDCMMDQFEVIYRRHFRLASEAAAPLLANLSERQLDTLERAFRKEAQEDAEDNAPGNAAKRKRKRAERYEKNMQWWIGELDDRQRAIVQKVADAMPETAGWYAYRDRKRRELIKLLRANASAPRIERFLVDWLVEYRDMPAALSDASGQLRSGFANLLLDLDPTLSDGQRRQLIDRLTKLRDDFMRLQKQPRMAPVAC